jgi:CRISPR type III-A-associated RAMP protein Csm5
MRLDEFKIINIETITPIFIGAGETTKPLSYITGRGMIHLLNFDKFLSLLNTHEQQVYIEWVETISDKLSAFDEKISRARDNLDLRRRLIIEKRNLEKEFSIDKFIRNKLQTDPIRFIHSKDIILYSVSCLGLPGSDGFKLHLKNTKNQPYIPGTELKGALRTAILFTLLANSSLYTKL